MFFMLIIVVGTWLIMAMLTICALVAAARRPAGRSEEEAVGGMRLK